jgi:hypothetical protein
LKRLERAAGERLYSGTFPAQDHLRGGAARLAPWWRQIAKKSYVLVLFCVAYVSPGDWDPDLDASSRSVLVVEAHGVAPRGSVWNFERKNAGQEMFAAGLGTTGPPTV